MSGTTCFLAELVGTALLILLGNGVVANVKLEKSGMKDGGTVQITIAWGLAVLLPAFIFGETTGAHFNPVLSIAFAVDGSLAPGLVGWYVAGQMLGGMLGAFLAWALYCKHFAATTDGASGSVRLGFAAAPERVEVDSSSGSVTLSFPKGTGLDLDYDSGSGKLRGEVIYGDLPVKVDTGSGSLTIEYK